MPIWERTLLALLILGSLALFVRNYTWQAPTYLLGT